MEIIYVFNGLGNQMSQYALYLQKKALGQNVKCVFKDTAHNGIELKRLFGIETNDYSYKTLFNFLYKLNLSTHYLVLKSVLLFIFRIFGFNSYIENRNYVFQPTILREKRGFCLYIGGWHHYLYFDNIELEVRNTYRFPRFKKSENLEIAKAAKLENAVAIHIRKGDYMDKTNYPVFGSVCTDSYYQKAIERIESIVPSPIYYVFSNDMESANKVLVGRMVVYVNWNKGSDSWADMALMSRFKNIIIPNSTFSWWAAWLGRRDKIVLCPRVFVNNDPSSDIYMPGWIRI